MIAYILADFTHNNNLIKLNAIAGSIHSRKNHAKVAFFKLIGLI